MTKDNIVLQLDPKTENPNDKNQNQKQPGEI